MQAIAVNGRFFSQMTTGVQRYAFELLRSLDELLTDGLLPEIPITVYVPSNTRTLPNFSFLRVKEVGQLTGQAWEQIDLPRYLNGELLFTPCGGTPILYAPHVITIHDACVFATRDAFTKLYGFYYRNLFRHLSRTALHVITVSEFSRYELIKYLGISSSKITSIYLSGKHILRPPSDLSILQKHSLERKKYVLAVSSRNPNKNFSGLVRACQMLSGFDIRIAIAGGSNSAVFGETTLPSASLVDLGFIGDSELRSLYENAACFVFPSFYEGFGLPPLEAITLGCPTVAARAASLPEVLGEAAVYCDPASPSDIAAKIATVLSEKDSHQDSAAARASLFTWERCARETWSILTKAVS